MGEEEAAAACMRGLDNMSSLDMETVLPGVPLFAREGVLARLPPPPPPVLAELWCTMVGKRSVRRRWAVLAMKPPPESRVSPRLDAKELGLGDELLVSEN